MLRSIRWRLVASHVFLTLLTVGLAGLLVIWGVRHYAEQQETRYLQTTARSIAEQALPLMQPQIDHVQLAQLVETTSFLSDIQVRVIDEHGSVLAESGWPRRAADFFWYSISVPIDPEAPIPGIPTDNRGIWLVPIEALEHGEDLPPHVVEVDLEVPVTVVRRVDRPWGSRFEFTTQPRHSFPRTPIPDATESVQHAEQAITVPVGEIETPLGFVELRAGTDFEAEALAFTRRAFLLGGVGAVLLAVILGLVMGARLSAPITDLTETTRKMSAGDLAVRARVKGKDEIGELAAQFNQMAEQLQASFAQVAAERDTLRRFIADASHELRTPITALKNFNELLQEAAAEDPAARAEFLSESQAQLDRLAWITQNLLDLSRLDAGLAPLEIAAHDVGDIVASALAPFKARASDKPITLETDLPETPCELRCDRARLELALSNLLDNAVKFTPQGGQVLVSVEQAGQDVHIRVEDSGAGIHPDDLPHIFERFYRGQRATQEGSGLGLSIVHSVVQAHGGHINVESEPGEGARFEIILPGEAQA